MTAAHEAQVAVPDPARSFDPYLEALRRDPQFVEAQQRLLALALDFALGGRGPVEAAQGACRRVLELDPAAHRAHAALAEIELRCGRPAAAEEHLRHALRLRPDWAPAYERLGTSLLRRGAFAESITWFERAVTDDPLDGDALLGLGVALAALGRAADAVSALRRAVDCGLESAEVHDELARALATLGRRSEARVHRRAARTLRGGRRFGLDLLRDAWQWLTGG
jgi:tetratricopeptide (TPR) repeat protein